MSAPFAAAPRRSFLLPIDLGVGLVTLATGGWLLGSTWGGPLALAGVAGACGCALVGTVWTWSALRSFT